MMLPTIHINGTSGAELFDAYITAMHAVEAAIQAVNKTAPNGRDYYPQSQGALRQAQAAHEARLRLLNAVCLDMLALAEHAQD